MVEDMQAQIDRSLRSIDDKLSAMEESQRTIREAMEKTAAIMAVFVQRIERIDATLASIEAQAKRFRLAQKIED